MKTREENGIEEAAIVLKVISITYMNINQVYDIELKSDTGQHYISKLCENITNLQISDEICKFVIKYLDGEVRIFYTLRKK